MKKTKLLNKYVEWSKLYLIYKLNTLERNAIKDSFSVSNLEHKYNNANSMKSLHEVSKDVAKGGLKAISTISISITLFLDYILSLEKVEELNSIDTQVIKDFINEECLDRQPKTLGYGTRKNYRNGIVGLFNYIDNEGSENPKFRINDIKVTSISGSRKPKPLLVDWMDKKMCIKFNKEILKYTYQSEVEKCRDILIARLFLFSGISPMEMKRLKKSDFLFEDGCMSIHIIGNGSRDREIPLPKTKLIRYYNRYLEIKEMKCECFFYSPTSVDKPIDTLLLTSVTKRLLEFAKIKVRDLTPAMLRKSFLILLNNEPDPDTGLTQPEKNIQELSGIQNITELRQLLKFNSVQVMTASNVFDNLNFD